MVCPRCQTVVKKELEKLGLHPETVELGTVTLRGEENGLEREKISAALAYHGFVLLDDKKEKTVEQIKNTVIELVHYQDSHRSNLSQLIEERIGLDYAYLSSLFSSAEGVTIEKYTILQRIERAKELIVYDELSLSQIADQLGYSSVQHLSTQFKKITGLTPSYYKQLQEHKRRPLDEI